MPTITKWFKKIASMFAEKPAVETNDFELEHFLLYHGLVGSSPENERQFKDVRSDIRMAFDNRSSAQLAVNLKLSPLWWEEKLKTIFAELGDRESCINLLAPPLRDDAMTHDDNPLFHSDWRVRSNAAFLLANLNATEKYEELLSSFNDTAGSARIAFSHLAYSLARLGNQAAEEHLVRYLSDEDPWIRVDSAGALALLTRETPSKALQEAILVRHPLSDYTAVAVARSITPRSLVESSQDLAHRAGCELIAGVLEAAAQTFTDDIVVEYEVPECFPKLVPMIAGDPSAQTARAGLLLAQWLQSHHSYTLMSPPPHEDVEKTLSILNSKEFAGQLSKKLSKLLSHNSDTAPGQAAELRSAILLAGQVTAEDSIPALQSALSTEHPLLDELVGTLGSLHATSASSKLIEIAESLVNLEQRSEPVKQANPVHENNKKESKTYWLILKSLGQMPAVHSLKFLLRAAKDHAPDKRAQAFDSLVAGTSTLKSTADSRENAELSALMPSIETQLTEALSDPSAEVRKAALRGIALLDAKSDLKKIVALTRAKEVSVGREAFGTLSELAKKGHKKEVIESVGQALKTETDVHKRQRLKDFIDATAG